MKRKTFSNYVSLEKKRFNQNAEKYRQLEKFARVSASEEVEISVSEISGLGDSNDLKYESSDREISGLVERPVSECESVSLDNDRYLAGHFKDVSNLTFNTTNEDMCSEIKYWAIRNNINHNAVTDLLQSLTRAGVKSLPSSAKSFFNTKKKSVKISHIPEGEFLNMEILRVTKDTNRRIAAIEKRMEAIENKLCDSAQDSTIGECKELMNKVSSSVAHMTVETVDGGQLAIGDLLPIDSMDGANEIEQKLEEEPEFASAMKKFLLRIKRPTATLDTVMKTIITDETLCRFNWDGTWGKRALKRYTLFNGVLRDVYITEGRVSFESQIRKVILKTHNRIKQKKSRNKGIQLRQAKEVTEQSQRCQTEEEVAYMNQIVLY